MDKEKEVKRYSSLDIECEEVDTGKMTSWVKFTDWQAERTKRLEAEKKYKDLNKSLMAELRDPNGTIWEVARDYQKKNDELEAKVKELDKAFAECYALNQKQASVIDKQNAELQAYSSREVVLDIASHGADSIIDKLKNQLSQANAKIVELEKHDCEKFIDEGLGCSICSNLHLDLNKAKEIQDHVNWRISSLETELSTANKKAEKLVDVIKRFMSRVEYDWQSQFEQALKEWRGGK